MSLRGGPSERSSAAAYPTQAASPIQAASPTQAGHALPVGRRVAIFAGAAVLGLTAALAGCSEAGQATVPAPPALAQASSALPSWLLSMEGVLDRTAFRGERVVTLHGRTGPLGGPAVVPTSETFQTRQTVAADGTGQFAIELAVPPLALPIAVDPITFPLAFERSTGAQWRLREFRVRDLGAMLANYAVVPTGVASTVAGIDCEELELERYTPLEERPGRYRLQVDVATGFVLAMEEYDFDGSILEEFHYESFSYEPSFDGVTLRGPSFPGTPLDVAQPLTGQAGFPVLEPEILPDGFQLVRASTFVLPAQAESTESSFLPSGAWVRVLATDGVEALSFAHAHTDVVLSITGEPAVLRSLEEGSWRIAFGRIRGVSLVCTGRVGPSALRRLVESAF